MLNEALRLVRVYHNLTQTQLSYDLGISNSFLSEIESGKKNPSLDLVEKYGKKFDLPVSSLIFFSENLENPSPTKNIRLSIARKAIVLLNWGSKMKKPSEAHI